MYDSEYEIISWQHYLGILPVPVWLIDKYRTLGANAGAGCGARSQEPGALNNRVSPDLDFMDYDIVAVFDD